MTARRREERLQDVPVAVTAISGEQLAERGVVKLEDIRYQAPGFQVQPGPYGSAVPAFQIRGQRQQEALITQDPSVGVYVDEVYQARVHGVNQSLLDLENVQVLKGPQGTLFGRNTTGGALLVVSRRPTDRLEGSVAVGLGNFDQREVTAILNLPASDSLRFRAALKADRKDGFVRNVSTGDLLGDERNFAFRLGALFTAGAFENYLTVQRTRTSGTGVPLISQGLGPAASSFPSMDPAAVAAANAEQAALGFYEMTGDLAPNPNRVRTFGVTDIATLDVGDGLTLKNVFGYREIDTLIGLEFDGSSVKTRSGVPFFNAINQANEHQVSEELQLQGKLLDDRLSFVIGGYYFREKGRDFQQTIIGGYGISQAGGGRATNRSMSLFGQVDIKLTGTLTALAGIRYSWDRRTLDARTYVSGVAGLVPPSIGYDGLPPAIACNNGTALPDCLASLPAYRDKRPTWTAGLSWKPSPSTLVYANVSRGYRSGGYNLRGSRAGVGAQGSFGPFRPEIVTNYEGGVKLDFNLAAMPVRANLSVYHQDYKDIQRSIFAQFPGEVTAQSYILNAAAGEIDGGELELSIRPVSGLSLAGYAAYTRPEYKRFSYVVAANADGSGTRVVDGSDNPFAGTPKWQFGANARYEYQLDDQGTIAISGQYYHQDRIYWSDNGERRATSVPYGLVDLRLEWNGILGSTGDLAAYVRNLTDKKYKALGASGYDTLGFISYIPGLPRTYGSTLTIHF
ncbi:iron complex outermembrane receptor protein [Sphingomonas zeicaulis]|uniref:TonB-dependent receptor n=1 Tax=Sphingomonas zeicaulis TaxID=1632740 RepID=UPI003D25BCF8